MGTPTPLVSVVIPAYNEGKSIEKTLNSLLRQDYPNFEVIVVDNNSTDNTALVVKNFKVTLISEKQKGVAHARQAGFTKANGEIIVSTDADTLHSVDWLTKIVQIFQNDEHLVAVGGLGEFYSGPKSAKLASQYLFYPFLVVDKLFSGGWNLSGFNMAVRKKAFERIGGFSTNLNIGEDIDLSKKLRKIGKIVISKDITVKLSGRRYKDGLIRGIWDYTPSTLSRMFLRKSGSNTFRDVRE